MDLQLKGKKAIVTGGSAGMGKAIARQLAREGCDVVVGARTEARLQDAAAEIAEETGRNIVPLSRRYARCRIDRSLHSAGGRGAWHHPYSSQLCRPRRRHNS
jgi:short-subunit dehydrogenase